MLFIDQFNEEAKEAELIKQALVERLARLGATDVEDLPGMGWLGKTPRVVMRRRAPQELAQLQHNVERKFRSVEAPLERKLHKATTRLPRLAKKGVRKAGKLAIRNPHVLALQPVPIPGATTTSLLAKAGLEKAIDRWAPAASRAL